MQHRLRHPFTALGAKSHTGHVAWLCITLAAACGGGASDSQPDASQGSGGAAGTQGPVGSGGMTGAGGSGGSLVHASSGGSGGASSSGGTSGSGGIGNSRDSGMGSGGSGGSGPIDAGADASIDAGAATDCMPPKPGSHGKNPLFSDQFTADPGAFVHDCIFYIQCGHDEAAVGQNGFNMKEWFLLSSTDMVSWTKKVALSLTDFTWANANAWAGQMVTKNGKFYWFVPVNESSSNSMALAVAVADSPTGPFKDALGKALIDDAFEMSNMGFATPSDTPFTIDPTVFVDDDGQAYLHYGGFSRMIEAKLSDDMLSIDGKMKEVTPQGFFEAAFLTKRDDTYYEIYAAGQNPATIDYSTSNNPLGPWTYRGRVLDALPAAANQDAPTNHSAVAQFAGQWYLVYHKSNGPNGGGTYRREVAVDKLSFNPDGSIQKVMPSEGLSF